MHTQSRARDYGGVEHCNKAKKWKALKVEQRDPSDGRHDAGAVF